MGELDELADEETRLIGDARRADRAQRLLDDDLFKEAMQAVMDKAIEGFKVARPNDAEALKAARYRLEVAEDVLNEIVTHVQTGQMNGTRLSMVQSLIQGLKRG